MLIRKLVELQQLSFGYPLLPVASTLGSWMDTLQNLHIHQAPSALDENQEFSTLFPFFAKLKAVATIRSERAVKRLTFDVSESFGKFQYEAGDHLAIFPQNNHDLVLSVRML